MKRWWFVGAGIAAIWCAFAPTGATEGAGPFSFPHQPHISEDVVTAGLQSAASAMRGVLQRGGGGTVDAECIVCHDFTKSDDAHLTGCYETCHVAEAYLEVVRADASPSGRTPFPHAKHLESGELSCFSCHRTQVEEGWVEFSVPPPSLGPRGTGGRPGGPLGEEMCADCHAEHVPADDQVPQDAVTGDGKRCGTCHTGRAAILPMAYRDDRPTEGAVRPFRHADHGGSAGVCETCHSDIDKSSSIWDYDPTAATAAQCSGCHVKDAEGTSLIGMSSPPRTSRVPYVWFSKFPHDKHLAQPTGDIEVSGNVNRDAQCETCHYPEADPASSKLFPGRVSSDEPVGRAELVDYRACEPCHASWKVESHGIGWGACFKCHTGVPDADGKFPIGTTAVERDAVTLTSFTTHHHPGITRKGAALDDAKDGGKACRECHIGESDELPSRLRGKDFAHGPHVPENPGDADCLACHPTAATTSYSEDLRRFEARSGGAGSVAGSAAHAKGCIDCHVGGSEAELGVTREKTTVPQFDHKAHVTSERYRSGEAGIPCVTCHVPGGESGYSIPDGVLDCTQCHSHDEKQVENFARTGPAASSGEAKLCLHCHEEVLVDGATPDRKERVRQHLDLLPGTQFHDLGGDCAVCHERDGLEGAKSDYRERITAARVIASIHDDRSLADAWFNDPRVKDDGVRPEGTCKTCHRRDPQGYLRSLGR